MCPCNLSFDHGATYDYCRVTLVFNIREGEVEGTDVGGLNGRRNRRHAEGDDRGELAARHVHRRARDATSRRTSSASVFSGQLGGPMAALAPLVGEMLGVERVPIEVRDDGLRHSVRIGDVIDFEIEDIVPFGIETGEPVQFTGMFHPVGVGPDDRRGRALEDQRVRDRVRRADGPVDVRVRLGRLSR